MADGPGIDTRLQLAPHVRACALDGQVILLDLRSSRYHAVAECASLSREIGSWPAPSPGSKNLHSKESVKQALCLRGLLVPGTSGSPRNVTLPTPTDSIDPDDSTGGTTGTVLTLAFDALNVASLLRFRSLEHISGWVERMRPTAEPQGDLDRLAGTYARLRPILFTSRDKCLFDSLTMLRFLSHWNLAAIWVIGVTVHPFAAHSWIQAGPTVLNDHHERVRRYKPILVT